jgi:hypothetical protein
MGRVRPITERVICPGGVILYNVDMKLDQILAIVFLVLSATKNIYSLLGIFKSVA